jgi:hypothetical protein
MAESDGGSVETVVLTDPLDPRHPRQARGQAQTAMFHRSYADGQLSLAHRFRKAVFEMVAQAKSVLTVVTAPFDARDRFRARPCRGQPGVASAQFNPECAPTRRTMAIDSNPNAISASRAVPRRGHPPLMRLLPQVLPSIAMSRVQHGKQDANRCLPPGRNPGCGGTWSKSRRIRLRIR